ncbi:hypothetical protein F2Q70_00043293 [Brassica cretica]|uniref:Uncharacterized protein n=1 Tax=Brassica cretica TaxID=69181 RepID=A0A8S9LM83_BRACR|nr:hypothetical protein F2Q70_00043293 [Brassica cretica]KAF2606618.1 hypothetical protein F2Q68_00044198 [Brassica cretica]
MGSSVSTMPRAMANKLGLKIKTSRDSFTFVDFSKVDIGEIVRDLQVETGDHLVHVDLYVIDIQIEWNTSLLLGRAFMTTAGAVCDMLMNNHENEDDDKVSIDTQSESIDTLATSELLEALTLNLGSAIPPRPPRIFFAHDEH